MREFFKSKEALLYVMAIALMFAFSAWLSLLNNFVVEKAYFDGSQIGILQSLREVPGFLAFTVVFVLLFINQQNLTYLSIVILGLGVIFTGYFPNEIGLYITTVIMSIGFHFLQVMYQSLSLQWLSKEKAPLVLGKIAAVKSFTSIVVFVLIYILMKYFMLDYQYVYLFFGSAAVVAGIAAWMMFDKFKDDVVQEKKLVLKKQYWLFYLLTFFSGSRRQIFIVFAGFLLVEKFGVDVHNMVSLFFVNALLNMYFAPKIGKFIAKFGERITLRVEYFGLVLVFVSYAFVENLYFAYALFVIDHLLFAMAIALKTYFQKIADPKDLSSVAAVSFTIDHIAAVFIPALLGIVWLYSNSLVFIIGASIAFISFALSFLIPKNPQMGMETIFKTAKKV